MTRETEHRSESVHRADHDVARPEGEHVLTCVVGPLGDVDVDDAETATGLEPADDGVAPIVNNTGFDGDAATG